MLATREGGSRVSKVFLILLISLYIYISLSGANVGYCISVVVNNSTASSSYSRCESTVVLNFQADSQVSGKGNSSKYASVNGFAGLGMKEISHTDAGISINKESMQIVSAVGGIDIEQTGTNNSEHYTAKIEENLPSIVYDKQDIYYNGKGINTRNAYSNGDEEISTNFYGTKLTKSVGYLGVHRNELIFVDVTPARAVETVFINKSLAFGLSSNSNQYSGFEVESPNNRIDEEYRGSFKLTKKISSAQKFYLNETDNGNEWLPCYFPEVNNLPAH
jgi:hypothetical protein